MKHTVYAIQEYIDDKVSRVYYSKNKQIRSIILDLILLKSCQSHYNSWCKLGELDPKDYNVWEEYKQLLQPGKNKVFIGTVKMDKKDKRWSMIYDKKKLEKMLKTMEIKAHMCKDE